MSKKYLLDTNVCIFLLQDKFGVADHIRRVGRRNCYVSELTIAELLYGLQPHSSEIFNRTGRYFFDHELHELN